jgi:amyloid beta precursor protein binding protein 1
LSQQEKRLIWRSDRLWAASGQSALESSRILVISGSATSTSILKNLVLPGIGHFTILDPEKVTPEDAGNNFFLEGSSSIGKSRAEEAVRLLGELNDGVEGKADVRSLEEVLANDKEWLSDFTIVIAHNLEAVLLNQLASFLWEDSSNPPLVIVRSAGFLAEVYTQYHEHAGMYVVRSISRV